MKKKYISGVMFLALLVLGSCGKQQSYIGAEEAKQLALDTCSKTAEEADSVTSDLVRHDDKDYYQVDIVAGGQHYQIEIDALAGAVAGVKVSDAAQGSDMVGNSRESEAAAGSSDSDQMSSSDMGQSIAGQANQPDGIEHHSNGDHGTPMAGQSVSDPASGSSMGAGVAGGGAGTGAAEGIITLEDAEEKVLAHAGLTADQVTFVETGLEYENGRQVYELEFYTSDYKEYDYEVDASSGEIVSFDYDAEHYMPSESAEATITADDAKALALSKVPGASESDIREFDVDYDDRRTEYEGKIIYNGREYEFEIDSWGQILSWEEEPAGRR